MPLVRDQKLDAWDRLRSEGIVIVNDEQARQSRLRQLHIGFVNMMPDRAFRATERQFLRLVAAGGDDCLIYIHPISVDGLARQDEVQRYVESAYKMHAQFKPDGLDGLILTGANPGESDLKSEEFWPHFEKIIRWADSSVPTVMCSCLASHAVLHVLHGVERTRCHPDKRWGVYSHQIIDHSNPLVKGVQPVFDTPRSHVFEMKAAQLEPHQIRVLATSPDADFHIAVSSDGFKWVFLQGHPEYDAVSLLKEYNREILRFLNGERADYPDYPHNYLNSAAIERLDEFKLSLLAARDNGAVLPRFPEADIVPMLSDSWSEAGRQLYRNWLRIIQHKKEADEISQFKSADIG